MPFILIIFKVTDVKSSKNQSSSHVGASPRQLLLIAVARMEPKLPQLVAGNLHNIKVRFYKAQLSFAIYFSLFYSLEEFGGVDDEWGALVGPVSPWIWSVLAKACQPSPIVILQ